MKAIRAKNDFSSKIWALFRRDEWAKAQKLLEKELVKDPDNHWLLTQLGVSLYEQRRYKDALNLFLESRKLVGDCPLTLWNLAGSLDALGKHAQAVAIYTLLLESKVTPREDPCWESKHWADSLKTDCVYRIGVCFQKQGNKKSAVHCFRQYLDLLSIGANGSYSSDAAIEKLRSLLGKRENGASRSRRLQKAVRSVVGSLPRVRRDIAR